MLINGKEYRIKETVYKDGQTDYTAQYAINFWLFKIWRDYIIRYDSYYGNKVPIPCFDIEYERCCKMLIDDIEKKKKAKEAVKKVKTNYYE